MSDRGRGYRVGVDMGAGGPGGAPGSMARARRGMLFMGGVAVAYLLYLVISGQIGDLILSMSGVDAAWIRVAMLAYGAYYLLGVAAYVLAVIGDRRSPVGIRDLMSVEATGIFFSNLTPNGAGGAPAQIYRLMRAGLTAGGAGAVQYARFVIYEASEGIFAAIMLLFRWDWLTHEYGNVYLVGVLLFACKALGVAALLFVCLYLRPALSAASWAGRVLRSHGRDDLAGRLSSVAGGQITQFSDGFRRSLEDRRDMAATLAVTLTQLTCLYALPWFVSMAFRCDADVLTCLACGSMIELLTSAVPLPGGALGAEAGFAFLFAPMFGSKVSAAYVVWRTVEYVMPTLFAAPLMGLRSHGHESIAARCERLMGHVPRRRGSAPVASVDLAAIRRRKEGGAPPDDAPHKHDGC